MYIYIYICSTELSMEINGDFSKLTMGFSERCHGDFGMMDVGT